jgi:hypothetical protein
LGKVRTRQNETRVDAEEKAAMDLDRQLRYAHEAEGVADRNSLMMSQMIELLRRQNYRLTKRMEENKLSVPPMDITGLPAHFSLQDIRTGLSQTEVLRNAETNERQRLVRAVTAVNLRQKTTVANVQRLYGLCKKLNRQLSQKVKQLETENANLHSRLKHASTIVIDD